MAKKNKIEQTAAVDPIAQLRELVARTNSDRPQPQAVKELRRFLRDNPDVVANITGLEKGTIPGIFKYVMAEPADKEVMQAEINLFRDMLTRPADGPLEAALVEHVTVCWVRLYLAERRYTQETNKQSPLASIEHYERRLTATQRRFLRALGLLSRLRRFAPHTVQINVANQQIVTTKGEGSP